MIEIPDLERGVVRGGNKLGITRRPRQVSSCGAGVWFIDCGDIIEVG